MKRCSGILLPIFSLPSPYGIGTMGRAAYQWIDFLHRSKQSIWQVLPIGPTGFKNSPYQSFSSFAGNPYFIDLDILKEKNLLKCEDYESILWCESDQRIDYGILYDLRLKVLKKAFSRFRDFERLENFKRENKEAQDYAVFMAIKNSKSGSPWYLWEQELKKRSFAALEDVRQHFKEEIDFYLFLQYEFMEQWLNLKNYANSRGIKIVGDVPIYASLDSCDVWTNPKEFMLDENFLPKEVAGCPPDAFTEDGQRWGNPLYLWDEMKKNGYSWWKSRLGFAFRLFDIVRIDHFRGLESYYAIPGEDKNARGGRWVKGPDKDFISFLKTSFKGKKIIAEDLGFLTQKVYELLDLSGYPGMKVMQFAFDNNEENQYLPHKYKKNCVAYTGTHDNDTVMGFLSSGNENQVRCAKKYLGAEDKTDDETTECFIRAVLKSSADTAVIPIQDYLHLKSEARINTPSTQNDNWVWRLKENYDSSGLYKKIALMTEEFSRC